MAGWMLDTNAASAVIKGRSPELDRQIAGASVCISVITEAELRFGLVRRQAQSALVRSKLQGAHFPVQGSLAHAEFGREFVPVPGETTQHTR